MPLLNVESLQLSIADTQVCQSLSFEVEAGQRWAMLGRNGIGKSTLLHTIAGLRNNSKLHSHGSIELAGENIERLKTQHIAQQVGILFQQQEDAFNNTVLETALIGRHPYLHPWQWESEEDQKKARQALEQMSLAEMAQRTTNTLSGGERQRLALATLLTQTPKLILLDEPTNHLDIHHQIRVLDLLSEWALKEERALIMTLHDVNLALRYCDHAVLLFGKGETIAGSAKDVLTRENLERLYMHPLNKLDGEWGQAYLPR